MHRHKYARIVLTLFTLAALLYNSWPLAYILNSGTAHNGLASDLDAAGQPYNWVFIWGDVLVGATLLAVTVLMRLRLRPKFWSKVWSGVFIGLLVFGLFTATSAALPSHCQAAQVTVCASFGKRILGPDGIESTMAALGLLASLIAVSVLSHRYKLGPDLKRSVWIMLIAWPASGIYFLIATVANGNAHLAQQILLIFSGLALLVIGLSVNAAIEKI